MNKKNEKSIDNLNKQKIDTENVQGGKTGVDFGNQADTQADHFVDGERPSNGGNTRPKPRPDKTREGSIF